MAGTPQYWKIRIRDVLDTTDAFFYTSLVGNGSPYIEGPPTGDGEEIDPLSGNNTVAAYKLTITDPITTNALTRSVTSILADTTARMQLLSRRAYIEHTADGITWVPYVAGYVNQIRLASAAVYEITVGDSRRVELNTMVFQSATPNFLGVKCVVGGPIIQGWGPVQDYGPVQMRVTAATALRVELQWFRGPAPPSYSLVTILGPGLSLIGTVVGTGTLPVDVQDTINNRTVTYYQASSQFLADNILGAYPLVSAMLYGVGGGGLVGAFSMLAVPGLPAQSTFTSPITGVSDTTYGGPVPIVDQFGHFNLNWPATSSTPQPAVGTVYNVYILPTPINADNPCHFVMHPIDALTKLMHDNGVAYDATSATAVRATLGNSLRIAARITKSSKLADWALNYVYGPFGVGVRDDGSGRRQFFTTRLKSNTAPTATIGLSDLREEAKGMVVFDLDENTACRSVTLTTQRYQHNIHSKPDKDAGSLHYDIVPETYNITADDTATYATQQQTYAMEAAILFAADGIPPGAFPYQGADDPLLADFAAAMAEHIFDFYERGAIVSEIACLPSTTVRVGDLAVIQLPQLPGASPSATPITQRDLPRVVMVTRRSETPSGPNLKVMDLGISTAPSVVPAFTLVADPHEPRFHVLATITNGSALLAVTGLTVRIELELDLSPFSHGVSVAQLDPHVTTVYRFSRIDSGVPVSVRMRSEVRGQLPGAWSAWVSLTTTALNPVTSPIVVLGPSGDLATIKFTLGELDMPTIVRAVAGVPGLTTPNPPPPPATGAGTIVVVPGDVVLTFPGGAGEIVVVPGNVVLTLTGGSGGGVNTNPNNPTGRIGFSIQSGNAGKPGYERSWSLMTPGGIMTAEVATQERYLVRSASSPTNLTFAFTDFDALVNRALAAGIAIKLYGFTGNNGSPSPCYDVVIGAGQTAAEDFINTFCTRMRTQYGDIFDTIIGVNESLIGGYTTNPLYNEWTSPQSFSTGYLQYVLAAFQSAFPSARRALNFGHEVESGQQSAVVTLATGLVGAHPGLLQEVEWECHEDARQVESGSFAAAVAGGMTTTNATIHGLGLQMGVSEFDVMDLTGIGAGAAGRPARDELNRQAVQILGSWFIRQPNAADFLFWNASDNQSWENPVENPGIPASFRRSDSEPPRPDLLDSTGAPKTPYNEARIYFPQLANLSGGSSGGGSGGGGGGGGSGIGTDPFMPSGMTIVMQTGKITTVPVGSGTWSTGGPHPVNWQMVTGTLIRCQDDSVDIQTSGVRAYFNAGAVNDPAVWWGMPGTWSPVGTGWIYARFMVRMKPGATYSDFHCSAIKILKLVGPASPAAPIMDLWEVGGSTSSILWNLQGSTTNYNVGPGSPASPIAAGTWRQVALLVQPNSVVGAADGVQSLYIDNVLVATRTGVVFESGTKQWTNMTTYTSRTIYTGVQANQAYMDFDDYLIAVK